MGASSLSPRDTVNMERASDVPLSTTSAIWQMDASISSLLWSLCVCAPGVPWGCVIEHLMMLRLQLMDVSDRH